MNRHLPLVFLSLIAIGVLVIFGVTVFGEHRSVQRASEPLSPMVESDDPRIGSNNPRVVIVEFGDFECQACADVAPALKELIRRYPNEVQLVWKDFPITTEHPNAGKAAEAARCAGEQGKFWLMSDELFKNAGSFSEERAVEAARTLELDLAAFSQCLGSGRTSTTVARGFNEGRRLGVFASPTFYINSQRYETLERFEDFQRVIEAVLATS